MYDIVAFSKRALTLADVFLAYMVKFCKSSSRRGEIERSGCAGRVFASTVGDVKRKGVRAMKSRMAEQDKQSLLF